MPAIAMAIVYFGYIARMTRAGAIEALQSDYTRTATMKGLTTSQTMRRHVLRNALVRRSRSSPSRSVTCSADHRRREDLQHNGMGATMLQAAQHKDLRCSTAGVIVIGVVYMLATLTADLIHGLDEPPHPADTQG